MKVNNNRKMREALKRIVAVCADAEVTDCQAREIVEDLAGEALSAPARNCDVGTAEEQNERFRRFCSRHWGTNSMDGDTCEFCPLSSMECKFTWAQLPYEGEENR